MSADDLIMFILLARTSSSRRSRSSATSTTRACSRWREPSGSSASSTLRPTGRTPPAPTDLPDPRAGPGRTAGGARIEFRGGLLRLRPGAARPSRHQLHRGAGPDDRARGPHRQRKELDHQPRLQVLPARRRGEILVDGREIRSITGRSLHRQMGMVQQQNFLFSGSVLENIRLSKPEATEDEVRERRATRLGCLDVLEEMPDGLDTEVGERGAGLSVGQRQLVCFMRALLAEPADRHPRRGDELDRRPHRGAAAARSGDPPARAHELRRRPPAEHDPKRGPRARSRPGPDHRARDPSRAPGEGRPLRRPLPAVCAGRRPALNAAPEIYAKIFLGKWAIFALERHCFHSKAP